MALRIHKAQQGRYVRVGTAVGAAAVALVLSCYVGSLLFKYVSEKFAYRTYLVYGVPAVLFAVFAAVAFGFLNKPKVADFHIATETEMKKVSWSSRSELVGSTTIVIVTVVALAFYIYLADSVFVYLFDKILSLW